MFISFSNGNGSAFENSLGSGYPFASVPARCRKTTLFETWWRRRAETLGLLYGTTERSFNTVDKWDSTLTWTVCKAIGGSGWRGAANLYNVLIRGERWNVLMLYPIVRDVQNMRDVQRQRCWKRGSRDGQRLSLYDTTERSLNAVERWGSTLTWTVCTAADSGERQICTTCLFAENVGLWKDDSLAFSHRGAHRSTLLFERGWRKLRRDRRFDVPSRSETPKTRCQNHKQQLLRSRSGPSKAPHTRTTRVKEQQVLSKHWKKESN